MKPFSASFIFILLLSSCSPSSRDGLSREDQIVHLLDEKKYSEVIEGLEIEPDPALARYLAQAYLGRAGFEPIDFPKQVMAEQVFGMDPIDALIPGCETKPVDAFFEIEVRCALWRILKHLPKDQADVRTASRILSEIPQPTDGDRLLQTLTHSILALSSMQSILLNYEAIDPDAAKDEEIQALFDEIGESAIEAQKALVLAKQIPQFNISELLTGLEKNVLHSGSSRNLQYQEQTGLPLIVKIAQSRKKDIETTARKILILRQLDDFILEIQN